MKFKPIIDNILKIGIVVLLIAIVVLLAICINTSDKSLSSLLNTVVLGLAIVTLILAVGSLIASRYTHLLENEYKVEHTQEIHLQPTELTTIFDRITDGVVAFDTNFCFTYMNNKAGEILRVNPTTIIGKNVWKELPEGIDPPFYKAYHQAMATQQYVNVQEYYAPYNLWFENHIYPSANGLFVFFRDITEQKKYATDLEISEKRFRVLLENNPAIVSLTDDALNLIYRSPSSTSITGWTAEEIKAMGGINYFHPDDINIIKTTIAEAIKKPGIPQLYTTRYRHKNGHYIWLQGTATKLPDDSIVKGIVFNTHDITERKQAEILLIQNEERLTTILQTLLEQVVILDLEGEILYINHVAPGFTEEEVIGSNWLQWLHELDQAKAKEAIRQTLDSDVFSELQLRFFGTDRKMSWFNIRMIPMPDISNQQVLVVATDITDRKNAEEELRQSQNRTKKIFDSGMIGFIFWDANGEILDANNRFLQMTGYSRRDLEEKKIFWSKMTPPQYAGLDQIGLQQIARTGICQPFEKEYIRKDGNKIPILLGATSFEGNNPEKGVAYVMDMTERKKAQKEIKDYKDAIDLSSIVAITDQKGIIKHVNDNFCKISGYSAQELIGQDHRIINSGHHPKTFIKNLWVTIANGNIWRGEIRNKAKDGTLYWVDTTIVPFLDENGKPIQYIVIRADITERKKAEAEIATTTAQLRELTTHLQTIREEERKRIGREIHDELGQQLTAIKMDTVWIDKQIPNETVAIKDKLQNIIELLDGSHQSVRKILNELRPAVLDDNGLLEALQWQGRQFTESTGTPVHFTSNQSLIKLPQEIATCIFRVYQEALTNIMRYANASKVESLLNITNNTITLIIDDNGNGFNVAAVHNIKSFGLLGMKERVHSLNGTFNLVSSQGKGTQIVINLPLNM